MILCIPNGYQPKKNCCQTDGSFSLFARHGRALTGVSPEHAQIVGKAAWEDLQAYSWEYLPLINAGHYIANYAWNDHVKGLNNYSGLYFWNAGYVE